MGQLILLRHGESEFNKLNLFTGWIDVALSSNGITEALAAGTQLQKINIDCIFTSTLIRAQQTAMLLMSSHSSTKPAIITSKLEHQQQLQTYTVPPQCIPTAADWRFNERHYGTLQGMNKQEAADKYGAEQVAIWRRSFDTPPPEGESLAMTMERTIPALQELVLPQLKQDKNVLIVAHGNSLRSIIMHIENIAPIDIVKLEIATAKPIIYNFDSSHSSFTKV